MYLLPMVETVPSFNAAKDFVPVSQLARFEFGVVASPSIECQGLQATGGLAQGQSGQGDAMACRATAPFRISWDRGSKRCSACKMTRVPYRGSAPIVNDLIGGHLPFGITTIADAIPQHRAGGVENSRCQQRGTLAIPA